MGRHGELVRELKSALGTLARDRLAERGRDDALRDGDDDEVNEVLLAAGRPPAVVMVAQTLWAIWFLTG